jgi:hypothetical protein
LNYLYFLSHSGKKMMPIVALSILVLTGCGRWSAASLEEQTREHIDSQLEMGLDESTFKERFTEAQFWREEGGTRDYLMSADEVCIICYSHQGFVTSRQHYARIVRFENEKLVAIKPVEHIR